VKRWTRLILSNLGLLLVLVGLLELAGQLLYRWRRDRWLWAGVSEISNYALFERHPYLVGRPRSGVDLRQGSVRIRTLADSTRWTGAPAARSGRRVVACLGGSSTFGAGVSDQASWPAQLQRRLGGRYAVVNLGVPGYSSAEHVIQVALLVGELHPEWLILYVGWNDIRNYHDPELSADYYAHGMSQLHNLVLADPRLEDFFGELRARSGLVRIARSIRWRLLGPSSAGPVARASADPDPEVDRLYRRNLETIVALARRWQARVLLVPQVLNQAAYQDPRATHRWTSRIVDRALPGMLQRFNRQLDQVCIGGGCRVVRAIELQRWTPEDFVDDGHFSARGGRSMAELLAAEILSVDQPAAAVRRE
jgi:lysophospholipase L1-like esterase